MKLNLSFLLFILVILFYIMGFIAGFSVKENRIKQETIEAQQKTINNTTELKKEVCKVNEVIKKYEIKCNDILNFDLSKCL